MYDFTENLLVNGEILVVCGSIEAVNAEEFLITVIFRLGRDIEISQTVNVHSKKTVLGESEDYLCELILMDNSWFRVILHIKGEIYYVKDFAYINQLIITGWKKTIEEKV